MSKTVIEVEGLSKLYRLEKLAQEPLAMTLTSGGIGPVEKENPYEKIGVTNVTSGKENTKYVWALDNLNFSVNQGDVLGIIGRNGAGKSTLLKILSKITSPTRGKISIEGRVASLLEVGTGFHPEMTGRENAFMNGAILGMKRKEVQNKLDAIIDFAGIEMYMDTPVKRYSSGMKVRLGFAVAAHLDPEILIVDEVLAVGDAAFQKKCMGKMKEVSSEQGRTILFVSHNIAAVNRLCTKAILMKDGAINAEGSINSVMNVYLNETQQDGKISFSEGYLRSISIQQRQSNIELRCSYQSEKMLEKAIIGFVIADQHGNKICGSNPLHQQPFKPLQPSSKGEITVNISQPKLMDGTYILSVWFADVVIGVLGTYENVLSFRVMNMAYFDLEPNANVLGPVVTELEWHYEYKDLQRNEVKAHAEL